MKKIIYLLFLIFGFFSANAQQKNTKLVAYKVIIYGSDECHHCIDTKAFLTQNNIFHGSGKYALQSTMDVINGNDEQAKRNIEKAEAIRRNDTSIKHDDII